MTVKLYPTRLVLQDDERNDVKNILAYESAFRVNPRNLPKGWQRCALRANGGSGNDDTIEGRVIVDHLDDYLTQEDVESILKKYGGSMFFGGFAALLPEDGPDDEPKEFPDSIYEW